MTKKVNAGDSLEIAGAPPQYLSLYCGGVFKVKLNLLKIELRRGLTARVKLKLADCKLLASNKTRRHESALRTFRGGASVAANDKLYEERGEHERDGTE